MELYQWLQSVYISQDILTHHPIVFLVIAYHAWFENEVVYFLSGPITQPSGKPCDKYIYLFYSLGNLAVMHRCM